MDASTLGHVQNFRCSVIVTKGLITPSLTFDPWTQCGSSREPASAAALKHRFCTVDIDFCTIDFARSICEDRLTCTTWLLEIDFSINQQRSIIETDFSQSISSYRKSIFHRVRLSKIDFSQSISRDRFSKIDFLDDRLVKIVTLKLCT